MTDRVLSALRGLGIEASPLSLLEREDGFFALFHDLLIYQDEQGTRRVTLRDLTRIRSDSEGLLRVETPAGTALTANLMGFDPGQVQSFFAQVRDATARAKQLPTAPLPTGGGFKTFGSVTKDSTPRDSAPREGAVSEGVQVKEVRTPAAPPAVTSVQSAPAAPGAATPPGTVPPGTARAEPENPAVIKLGQAKQAQGGQAQDGQAQEGQSRSKPRLEVQTAPQGAPAGTLETAPAKVTVVSSSPRPAAPAASSVTPVPAVSRSETAAETGVPDALPNVSPAPIGGLAARAAAVAGLPGRLQVLAVVLGLAAIGLAFFQYQGGTPLNGLWTLIAGGVGSVALFVFADVTRLIVALARETAARTDARP